MEYVYFTGMIVVLFFWVLFNPRPRASRRGSYGTYDLSMKRTNWTMLTVAVVMVWPLATPLLLAYAAANAVRKKFLEKSE